MKEINEISEIEEIEQTQSHKIGESSLKKTTQRPYKETRWHWISDTEIEAQDGLTVLTVPKGTQLIDGKL